MKSSDWIYESFPEYLIMQYQQASSQDVTCILLIKINASFNINSLHASAGSYRIRSPFLNKFAVESNILHDSSNPMAPVWFQEYRFTANPGQIEANLIALVFV